MFEINEERHMKNALEKLINGEGESQQKIRGEKSRCLAPAKYAETPKISFIRGMYPENCWLNVEVVLI